MFFGFAKQTEKHQNRLSLGLFRFEPKKKFDCFEDTLLLGTIDPDVGRESNQMAKQSGIIVLSNRIDGN
jgi:hypothetical protein